jgi:hypothetical protein
MTPEPASQSQPSRAAVLVAPVVQLVLIVVGWGLLLSELSRLDATQCVGIPAVTPGWPFVVPAVLGVLAGRYSGAWHFFSSHPPDPATGSDRNLGSVLVGRLALLVIFALMIPIFVYEAIGVYQPVNGYEPITFYVRCAIRFDMDLGSGVRTMAILFVIGFLFGQWLWAWHPGSFLRRGIKQHVG